MLIDQNAEDVSKSEKEETISSEEQDSFIVDDGYVSQDSQRTQKKGNCYCVVWTETKSNIFVSQPPLPFAKEVKDLETSEQANY